MAEADDFTQKAKEAEALAASTENPLLRMTLKILAQDYRVLAEQENEPPGAVPAKAQQRRDQPQPDPSLKQGGLR